MSYSINGLSQVLARWYADYSIDRLAEAYKASVKIFQAMGEALHVCEPD